MNTLGNRILLSNAIFVIILLTISLLTYNFLQQGSKIRNLQTSFFMTNSEMMTLINEDQVIRRDEVHKPAFYQLKGYKRVVVRNRTLHYVIQELKSLMNIAIIDEFGLKEEISIILNQINRYNRCQQRLLALFRMKGFKDYGLEGQMRKYAHQLEDEMETGLSDVLMLRRHEKDYILRKDMEYVNMLDKQAERIKERYRNSSSEKDQQLFVLVDSYQTSFHELVKTEQAIGTENYGAIWELNEASIAVITSFQSVAKVVNYKGEDLIGVLVNRFIFLVIAGIVCSLFLGYFSAGFVSRSIRGLVQSILQARKSDFKDPEWQPSPFASEETKTLYNSYLQLLATIRQQFGDLESQTVQLTRSNEQLTTINELLESSQKGLEESNQVKDKFFSIIGHDLRGPMSNLTMSLELLSESMSELSEEEIEMFSKNILASADAISVLLDNLLVWAKTQTESMIPKLERFKLIEIVNGIEVLQSQRLSDKSIHFLNEIDTGLEISADKNMIELVMRNLLDNAIKFTRESGVIKIGTEVSTTTLKITVADNGVGIEPDAQSTLFTSLVKSRSQGTNGEKGAGLGLMLAYDFIRKHEGELVVSSIPNEGSTFTIILPIKFVNKFRDVEVV